MTSFFEDLVGISILLVIFIGIYLKGSGKTIGQFFSEVKEVFK